MPEATKEKKQESPKESRKKRKSILELDDAELKALVQKDINKSEAFINQNITPKLNYCYKRYLGIRDSDVDLEEWQSDQTMNLGFGMVTGEVSQLVNGMYQPNQFFSLKPHNEKSRKVLEAMEKLIPVQANNMNFYKMLTWIVLDTCVFGTGWVYMTWEDKEKVREIAKAEGKDKVKTIKKRKKISQPKIKSLSPFDVVYDTEAEDINESRFVAPREWLLIDEIRDDERYNGPDVNAFLSWIDDKDIQLRPTRILTYTYWTDEAVVVITESNHIIRKQQNLYNRIPLRCMVKYPLQREIVGVGTIESVGDQLDYYDEIMNTAADGALLSSIPMYHTNMDLSAEDTMVHPGKVWRTKQNEVFEEVKKGSIGYDWMNITKKVDEIMNRINGNQDQLEATGVDTATESRQIAQRSNTKKQAYIDYNNEDTMKWIIEFWVEMNVDNLSAKQIAETIGEIEWQKAGFKDEDLKDLKEMDIDYSIVLTCDSGLEDRLIAIQNVNNAVSTMAGIAQLKQLALPINTDLLIKHTLSKFDFPEGIYVEPSEMGGEEVPMTIDEEIAATESEMQLGQGQLIEQIAAKEGMNVEQVKQGMAQAGGLKPFLQALESKKQEVSA